ncbi:DNA cytosine methyltransferase [Nodularia spumigena]|jgi:DNA (cytosine-5)-methyltransferase 1|uniref:DNA (cytosine-5-)-methyltransferase n=1 Tax=Nodularia spumigena UHCC 0060 TaxID=3110300 RepID=A0ABU5UTD4_NODSP|nr:DNA cytosine methyltransferase [Nodularia spumigena]MEA5527322.1 DNA cytosine methyltransferase [Nodularia spumigena UHCC 0143]MEA5609557.1 DNA cytosine methyltransferase [Nodularia spumigena UHCC 0060]MEA5613385.1 DNA cytosine methyltransferase [Nodularia spumigena UHCC 0040]
MNKTLLATADLIDFSNIVSSETPEKFLEKGLQSPENVSVGCLYPYLESKKLQDGSTVFYPRVIGERDLNNSKHWRWGFNWKEKINGVWKGRSIGSIPCGAIPIIRELQRQGFTREEIIVFIKRAKAKSPRKPKLTANTPIAVVLFAGGGGVEAGMLQAGFRPVFAVEFDPTKPKLSRAIAQTHNRNFSEYGCKVIQQTVQKVAASGFQGFPQRPDYLHASPVCANFSQAHTAKAGAALETPDDLSAAQAVALAIRQLQPQVFTLENVPRYLSSQSFTIILNVLESLDYRVNYSVVNIADYGLPQARRRLVLVASQDFTLTLPPTSTPVGWYGAISHLIPTMSDSQLLPRQQQALSQFLATNKPTPLLIERVGGRKQTKYKPGHLPANTILRSHFTDHKGCNRNKFADIWLPDGTVKSLSIQAAAILQGFPSWYEFPPQAATAGSIIGYSVPPSFATQLFIHIQQQLEQ